MATLKDIDPRKPITITGNKMIVSDDAVLVGLADRTGNQSYRNILTPVTEVLTIDAAMSQDFLARIQTELYCSDFEKNLQCVSETPLKEPLLYGWIGIDRFCEFAASKIVSASPWPPIRHFAEIAAAWKKLGVELVDFQGYVEMKLEPKIYVRKLYVRKLPPREFARTFGKK